MAASRAAAGFLTAAADTAAATPEAAESDSSADVATAQPLRLIWAKSSRRIEPACRRAKQMEQRARVQRAAGIFTHDHLGIRTGVTRRILSRDQEEQGLSRVPQAVRA